MVKTIDLNCDLAELEDKSDLKVMPFLSSCNIACGGHAGSVELMRLAVQLAIENQVVIGAHPGYQDREHFGRISMRLPGSEISDLIVNQVGLLQQIAQSLNVSVKYMKLHGALYHDAASNMEIAQSVVRGLQHTHLKLGILGQPGSALEEVALKHGFSYYHESFIDRKYQNDGKLVPRSINGAVLDNDEMEKQLKEILNNRVQTMEGEYLKLKSDSICIHGDHPGAEENARHIRDILKNERLEVRSFIT